jgi:hypothetical protein
MQTHVEPFALRFARPAPAMDDDGERTRISCIKGATRMSGAEIARIAAGGIGINPFDFTEPQTTQHGPMTDSGDPDWDRD